MILACVSRFCIISACLEVYSLPWISLVLSFGLGLLLPGPLLMYLDYLSLFCPLDYDRRRSTPSIHWTNLVSCPCHTRLLLFDPACVLTMFINKRLHLDPHASRLVGSVTENVNELSLFSYGTAVEPPEMAASTAEPPEVSVVSTY